MKLLLLPLLLMAIGCSYETLHRQAPENASQGGVICAPPDSGTPLVSYEQLVSTVFANKCLNCHSSARPAGGVALDTYVGAKNQASAILSLTTNNIMPPSPNPVLSADEKSQIEAWVSAGAPERIATNCDPIQNPEPNFPSTPPETGELEEVPPDGDIDFELIQSRILALKCFSCHATVSGNRGGLNLENYQNISSEMEGILEEVEMNAMPPPPRETLSDVEKQVLRIWFQNGMPNNSLKRSLHENN